MCYPLLYGKGIAMIFTPSNAYQHLTYQSHYSTMSLYLSMKGGYDVRHGYILHSRGGSKGTTSLSRDSEALHQAQGTDGYFRWRSLSYSCRGLQAICGGSQNRQTRREVTLTS